MTYTIAKNEQFGSIEISFEGKPAQAIRDALKALRFRWHGAKRVWYGYADEQTVRDAIDGTPAEAEGKSSPAEAVNRFGVRVGDVFSASWGYDQTQVDFFQVVELVGASSVRVREIGLERISDDPVSGMSSSRVYRITRELRPPLPSSVFIKDQARGDLKRLKSYDADGVSHPQFNLASFASARLCEGETIRAYESWYR